MSEPIKIIIGLVIGGALLWLVLAVVGTAAGWWDWLGLIDRRNDE